jgi:two-component system chemotaxis sensor kinase CheA
MVIEQDEDIYKEYAVEALEHLSDIENGLLSIEKIGPDIDMEVVNRIFRAAHSIKGGAGFVGLTNVKELAHKMESALGLIRSGQLVSGPEIINGLILAFDKLRELVKNLRRSDEIDISEQTAELARLTTLPLPGSSPEAKKSSVDGESAGGGKEGQSKPEVQEGRRVKSEESEAVSQAETSLRVNVSLLDSLMNLAGELVLSRNQLLQTIGSGERHALELVSQRIDMVTSEVQEAVMRTRMQPIGNVLNKFPRVVRDLTRDLGKEANFIIEGKEVELDKTLIEAINDPLTHLVRNAVDHGIEAPDIRRQKGKNPVGQIILKAYHEAGQVNIEIADDGKGMDGDMLAASAVKKGLITKEQAVTMSNKEKVGLIFLPGFSTADKVTDVSGRGVGMDVVKTNLDKLGGVVDINSVPEEGTIIRIKLPLTLAIIPSQLISTGGERYAIAQVNLDELLRIPATEVKERIERVGDAEVVRLRGRLLPLIRLADVLGIERTYIDPTDGQSKPDRRKNIADRRSVVSPLLEEDLLDGEQPSSSNRQAEVRNSEVETRNFEDRRYRASSAVNIVVVSAGAFQYGLVVDELHDSEEIVVKPLGRHIKHCKGYAGATIMGDGRVALILDVPGLAQMAKLTSMEGTDRAAQVALEATKARGDVQALLVFRNAEDEQFAVPLALVARIEKVKQADIELVGGKKVIQYRGASLPLFTIEEVAKVKPLADKQDLIAIVFTLAGREVGLLATGPVDAIETVVDIDDVILKQPGIMGSAIIGDHTTLMVDIFGLTEVLNPQWFQERNVHMGDCKTVTILLVEDTNYFRNQAKEFMEANGYNVIEAQDGMIAWELLQEHGEEIALVVTDIEMPNLDGFALTRKIRKDPRYAHLPVIAVTALAEDEAKLKGKAAGIDDYQVKVNKEKLLESIHKHLAGISRKGDNS